MDAFLMHLDEELINNRPGRYYGRHSLLDKGYSPRELAFWLNFYGIFYDNLYIPPNFLTDNSLTLKVLGELAAHDPTSLIRSSASPIRIYWEDRWPSTFKELVDEDWESVESVTSQKSKHLALEIAKYCQDIFSGRIDFGSVDILIDRMHSLKQMKKSIFSDQNAANLCTPREALRECVEKIEERPLGRGYGRNLLYAMFGYFRNDEPAAQRDLRDAFADIIQPFLVKHSYFAHEFLMGLDYVSHELKAKRASEILGRDLKLLLPIDYYEGYRRTQYDTLPMKLNIESSDVVFLDVDAILSMSPKQIEKIHSLKQRSDFFAAFAQLEHSKDANAVANTERHLGAYLREVGKVLHPVGTRISKWALALQPGCKLIGPSIAFAFVSLGLPAKIAAGINVAGMAVGLQIHKGLSVLAHKTEPSNSLPVSQIGLTEETRVEVMK